MRNIVIFAVISAMVLLLIMGCIDNDNYFNKSELLQGKNLSSAVSKIVNHNDTVDLEIHSDIQDTHFLNKKYYIEEGQQIVGRVGGIDFILVLTSASEKDGIELKINAKKHSELRVGNFVEMGDGIVLDIVDALYNDPDEKGRSVVFFSFEKRNIEHYSDILIEKNIDKFGYIESRKSTENETMSQGNFVLDDYRAFYDKAQVHILKGDKKILSLYFSQRFPDRSSLKEFDDGYIILKKSNIYASWLSKEGILMVELNKSLDFDEVEPLMSKYYDKYPSILTEDYNCKTKFQIVEKSSYTLEVGDNSYDLFNYAVSDSNGEVVLKVDGDFIDALNTGDYFFLGGHPVTLDKVQINGEGQVDSAQFCTN